MSNRWREIGRAYWFALQRSRRDQRSQQLILGTMAKIVFGTVYFLGLFYYFFIWIWSQSADNGTFGTIVALVAVSLVAGWLYRHYSAQDHPVTLQGSMTPARLEDIAAPVRGYLFERAVIVGALASRNIVEILNQRQEATPEQSGRTREAVNAQLRQAGLWEKLEPLERELCSVAGGSWPFEQVQLVLFRVEQLRLLRWVFRIDDVIVPLAHAPMPDGALTNGILNNPDQPLLNPWDVRGERDLANIYAMRLVAEQSQRGLLTPEGVSATKDWAEQLRVQSLGDSKDCVVGVKSVQELDNETLSTMATIAIARCQYAAYLVEVLSAPRPFPFGPMATAQAALASEQETG